MLALGQRFFEALAYLWGLKALGWEPAQACLSGFQHVNASSILEVLQLMGTLIHDQAVRAFFQRCFAAESGNPSRPRPTDVPWKKLEESRDELKSQFERLVETGANRTQFPTFAACLGVAFSLQQAQRGFACAPVRVQRPGRPRWRQLRRVHTDEVARQQQVAADEALARELAAAEGQAETSLAADAQMAQRLADVEEQDGVVEIDSETETASVDMKSLFGSSEAEDGDQDDVEGVSEAGPSSGAGSSGDCPVPPPYRPTKYGHCRHCQDALGRPVRRFPIVHETGNLQGLPLLRCLNWKYFDDHGRRLCWSYEEYTGDLKDLPKGLRQACNRLRSRLDFYSVKKRCQA